MDADIRKTSIENIAKLESQLRDIFQKTKIVTSFEKIDASQKTKPDDERNKVLILAALISNELGNLHMDKYENSGDKTELITARTYVNYASESQGIIKSQGIIAESHVSLGRWYQLNHAEELNHAEVLNLIVDRL